MEKDKIIKGSLTTVVLQLIKNNGEMYGYEMTKAVRESSQGKMLLNEAALYPTLHKLEKDGLIETEGRMVNGRMRKYYRLTQKGKKESTEQLSKLKEAMAALQNILKYKLAYE